MLVRTADEEFAAQLQDRLRAAVVAVFDEDSNAPADLALVQGLAEVIGHVPAAKSLPREVGRFLTLRDAPDRDRYDVWRLRAVLGTRLLNEVVQLPLNWLSAVLNRADEFGQFMSRPRNTWSNPRRARRNAGREHTVSLRELQGPRQLAVEPGDTFLVWDDLLDREVSRARNIDTARTAMLKYLKAPGHHETTIILVRDDEAIPIERWSV